jgi:hypothetical protein
MLASVLLRAPDGTVHELGHGDLIGRVWTAALPLDDARVSEAHAMVSLRQGELRLLALRARFAIDGEPHRELVLQEGQVIELARGVPLVVQEVRLPAQVLALAGPDLPLTPLPSACWLTLKPQPRLLPKPSAAAVAAIWFTGGWRAQVGEGPVQELRPGDRLVVGDRTFEAVLQSTEEPDGATRIADRFDAPLRIVCHYDTVVVERQGVTALTLSGNYGRLVSELAEIGAPVKWTAVARELWGDEIDAPLVRRRWDMLLNRLRRKLRDRSLRPDLVRSDGGGRVLLHLQAGDVVESK